MRKILGLCILYPKTSKMETRSVIYIGRGGFFYVEKYRRFVFLYLEMVCFVAKKAHNGQSECYLYRQGWLLSYIKCNRFVHFCIQKYLKWRIGYLKIPKNRDSECNLHRKGWFPSYVKYSRIVRFVSKTQNGESECNFRRKDFLYM